MQPAPATPINLTTSLAQLDTSRFDVFAVSSAFFWRTKRPVIAGFFENVQAQGGRGFLVTNHVRVCHEVHRTHPWIACMYHRERRLGRDAQLSRGRWAVVHHFLRRGSPVVAAGADVRFLQPVSRLFDLLSEPGVDAAFEGDVFTKSRPLPGVASGKLGGFTPDLIAAKPTANAVRFFERVVDGIGAPTFDGLPSRLRQPKLMAHYARALILMGPAEQDYIKDTFLSALYNRTVVARKFALAKNNLKHHEWALADCPGIQVATTAMRPPATVRPTAAALTRSSARGRTARGGDADLLCPGESQGRTIWREGQLPPLAHVELRRSGTLVRTPWLTVILSGARSKGFLRAGRTPCARCEDWDPAQTLALHCLDKEVQCLNISECPCLHVHGPHAAA